MITVKYRRAEPYSQLMPGDPFRPYVPVRIQNGGIFFDTIALIDSGADTSMFNAQIAAVLGIDLNLLTPSRSDGIGGSVPSWYYNLHLTVRGRRFSATVGFCDTIKRDFGLLGRNDFFAAFHVGFNQGRAQVLLHAV